MASNRHLGRIIVLQSLYELEFRKGAGDKTVDIDLIVSKNIIPYEKALGDTEFVYSLAEGIVKSLDKLDDALSPLAPEWPFNSISSIDRNVLRIGYFELSERGNSVPPKVAINEAVELAKAFGSENSSKFINGVLGTAYKKLGITEKNSNDSTTPEKSESKGSRSSA